MANSGPLLLFVDTSLDTHLGMEVSSDETVASLKRKIAAEHLVTFPAIGEINVQVAMICRKGIMYGLSDCMPIYSVFEGIKGSHLLYIEAKLNKTDKRKRKNSVSFEVGDPVTISVEKRRHKKAKVSFTEVNASCKERESDVIPEKEASKEVGGASFINNEGGDLGVVSNENIKHKKTKSASRNASPQEQSVNYNIFSKISGDVTFSASTSAAPEESVDKIISHVLADLNERSAIPPERLTTKGVAKELKPLYKKKLLVLDINGLLVDICSDRRHKRNADFKISGKLVFKRPFCDDFLDFCFTYFEIGVWSSRRMYNLKKAVDYLFGGLKNKLLFCWDQSKCTTTYFNTRNNAQKPLFFKELSKLWEKEDPDLPWEKGQFTPSNTLLVDDSPYKALRNPPWTAVFPRPYSFRHKKDNSLGKGGDLRVYLEKVATAEDVQCYVKENPFGQPAITDSHPDWDRYSRVLKTLNP